MYCNWGYQFIVEYRQYNKTIKIMIIEGYIAKLTKDYLLADSIQEMNRITNITRAILKYKYLI